MSWLLTPVGANQIPLIFLLLLWAWVVGMIAFLIVGHVQFKRERRKIVCKIKERGSDLWSDF